MALTSALNLATFGMISTELKVSLASQNITNADRAGYTRKTYQPGLLTTNVGTYTIAGDVNNSVNRYMVKEIVNDISLTAAKKMLSDLIGVYGTKIGSLAGEYSLADSLDRMHTGLSALAVSPEDTAYKTQVVNDAAAMAGYLNELADTLQLQRLAADKEIAGSVDRINESLDKLHDLNEKIVSRGGTTDMDTANYEDQRMYELQKLSEEIDIRYFFTGDDRVQIYLPSGQPLLLSQPNHLDFTSATSMNTSTTYPGVLDGVTVNGTDITTNIRSGKLAGLIEVRDSFGVQEQQKIDELAERLMYQTNAALNQGTVVPPRSQMIGDTEGLGAGTVLGGTGTFRVAVLDTSGAVVNYADLDLSTLPTAGALVAALNGIPGISASFTGNGQLQIDATAAGTGIAINSNNTSIGTAPNAMGVSHFFGLNNMFKGTSATDIAVSDYLVSIPDHMATGQLSMSATLAVGDIGVTPGDGTIAKAVADSLYASTSFDAAGNFVAQNNNLMDYTQAYMTNAIFRTDAATDDYDTASMMLQNAQSLLDSEQGVNIDEETAMLVQLETQYKASASIISTIQELFESLLAAVR
jgi:flagellar hook-associated protein 1 FlgK